MHKIPAIISFQAKLPFVCFTVAPSAPTILLFSTNRLILQPEHIRTTVITFFNCHNNVLIVDNQNELIIPSNIIRLNKKNSLINFYGFLDIEQVLSNFFRIFKTSKKNSRTLCGYFYITLEINIFIFPRPLQRCHG